MKITAITPYIVWVGSRNQLLVKIETDEGISGWGESGFSCREQAVAMMLDHFRPFLIGKDPFNAGAIWQECYRSHYFEGGRVTTAAIAAVDIALYDIKGKALGVPVYQLLGGKHRENIPAFATVPAEPGELMIEQALTLKDMGWKCLRFLAAGHNNTHSFEPRRSISETAHWLIKAREAIGHEIVLGVEYHHRLSVAEAASFCQKLPSGTLDFIEEPVRDETPEAYETLRKLTDIPFAIGEEFSSKWQFMPYIEREIHQYNRLDICNVGGFTEAMKVAAWSEVHYVDLMLHNPLGPICTAASVHLAAAIPNFSWLECRSSPLEQLGFDNPELFPVQPLLKGASYQIPEAPGLGVEVNEEMLKQNSFRYAEMPHLRRDDGSLTNW
ncbi:mandelate racemase/muconate lactonizing enzyme family protein [Citrobacter amalonaticus]|uniref:mandelate racemase/muconate lactonizing enzyme family protein n=1 Tax=Citrobacter amalonaticus TaxID=35703 RepID=UPI00207C3F2C|nr:mandelate racemase/muconate lactonizing enzyme family protein [Citrobacter amalonaticus]MCO4157006.1 mandelate racemase/muconate lactonizing enzyme family protein [Citrobacter amalonaticus]